MQRETRFPFIAEPQPIFAFYGAKIVQGERNAKGNSFLFHCRAAAYLRFSSAKIVDNFDMAKLWQCLCASTVDGGGEGDGSEGRYGHLCEAQPCDIKIVYTDSCL